MSRPAHLDGEWTEEPADEHGYRHFVSGVVDVRGFDGADGWEPDGELVTHGPVSVHIERMDSGLWSIILSDDDGTEVHADLYSKKPITVLWRDESSR